MRTRNDLCIESHGRMESGRCQFSRCGGQLAICGADGELKIWDSSTGILKQRFRPGQGPVTCLSWSRHTKHKRKRRKSDTTGVENSLLAVGVASEVIIWNLTKGEREAALSSSHSDSVTCVDWGCGNDKIYSGSSDHYLVEWSVGTGHETRKWKADRHSVECVCCHGNGSLLLSAGRAIKLWNLDDYTVIKKFTGHATSIRQMQFISENWFISSAENDRVINLWCSSADGKRKTASASLTCESEMRLAHAMLETSDDDEEQVVKAVGVCVEGLVHLFKCSLTNQIVAPISAHSSIQFVSTATKGSTPSPLPVLASHLSTDDNSVSVAHTSIIQPSFETIEFDQSERRQCLVRESKLAGGYLLSTDQERGMSKRVASPQKVTILGPGNMTLPTDKLPAKVDKQKLESTDDIPLKDRLETAGGGKSRSHDRIKPPSADSLTQLLVQSVASGDRKLLEEVLRVTKEKVVMATVRKIPLTVVLPFLRKLIELLQSSPARGLELSVWIRAVFTAHTAYLMTVPNLMDSLSGLYQLLDSRVGTFSKLCRLQGKLDLMLAQQTALLSDQTPSDLATAINTPLLTITAGEDSYIGNHVGEEGDSGSEAEDSSSSEVDVSSLSDDNSNQSDHSDSDASMETEAT